MVTGLGGEATEAYLKALPAPPRVLHLATHGFYDGEAIGTSADARRLAGIDALALLRSGVAWTGANRGAHSQGGEADADNGVLHALEAQTLNLYGTELVVLSACQTALGAADYSEGLEGLPRAFYLAEAKNVLVTLWPVREQGSFDFMSQFYTIWLQQPLPTKSTGSQGSQTG